MTSRGLNEADFKEVFHFVDRGVKIAQQLAKQSPSKKMSDFNATIEQYGGDDLKQLKSEVTAFARLFPTIGFEEETMLHQQ